MQCEVAGCSQPRSAGLVEVRGRRIQRQHVYCKDHAASEWERCCLEKRLGTGVGYGTSGLVPFELELMVNEGKGFEKILLREVGGMRTLMLPVGNPEMVWLYYSVEDSEYKWLSVHATMMRLINALGCRLLVVEIDQITGEGYFQAKACIARGKEVVEMAMRPSDGLCLALVSGAPYVVRESLLGLPYKSTWHPKGDQEAS